MTKLNFVDTTFRDGHHSLWAQGMRTGMMLPIAPQFDEIGFKAMEIFGGAMFKKCVHELREDPWQRLELMAGLVPNTPLIFMLAPSVTVFDITPIPFMKIYIEQLAAHGLGGFHLMEAANDFGNRIPELVTIIKELGLKITLAMVYSISPRHSDDYYAKRAALGAALDIDALYIKDPAGLLTIDRTRTLVPAVLQTAGGVPVEFHSHCTTGLAPAVYVEAMKLGIETVHTSIPPLANGSAQPSVFNVANNARHLGLEPAIDLDGIEPISRHFTEIARQDNLPVGVPLQYDVAQYVHHVPGGVISHLRHQLGQLGVADRLDEVLDEVGLVRAELGYPIMVTPFSQFVCTQAALNVITGERYKQVPDEVIQLILGHWGKEAAADIDAEIKDRILGTPRAAHFRNWSPPQTPVSEIRRRLGGPDLSDAEMILRYISPLSEIQAMRDAGPAKTYRTGRAGMFKLIGELAERRGFSQISVDAGGNSVQLRKSA